MKTTFPWTTTVVAVCLVAAVVVLTVTHNVSGAAFSTVIGLLPVVLLGTGYAENTNRNVKNGLVVKKVQQGLQSMGITPESILQSQEVTKTALDTLSAHTTALNSILTHFLPTENPNGPVHGG